MNPVPEQTPTTPAQVIRFKKIDPPAGFSYPVGAHAVSEAVAGHPMFDLFTLGLLPPPPRTEPLTASSSLAVLNFSFSSYPTYTPRNHSGSKVRQGGERWHIELFAVPAEWREAVTEQLLAKGLPKFREWLRSPEAPTSDSKRMSMTMWLEPNGEFVFSVN